MVKIVVLVNSCSVQFLNITSIQERSTSKNTSPAELEMELCTQNSKLKDVVVVCWGVELSLEVRLRVVEEVNWSGMVLEVDSYLVEEVELLEEEGYILDSGVEYRLDWMVVSKEEHCLMDILVALASFLL